VASCGGLGVTNTRGVNIQVAVHAPGPSSEAEALARMWDGMIREQMGDHRETFSNWTLNLDVLMMTNCGEMGVTSAQGVSIQVNVHALGPSPEAEALARMERRG